MTLAGSRLRLVTWQATPSSITKTSLAVKSATRLPIESTARRGKRTSLVTIRRRCSCSSAFWGGVVAVVCASNSLRQPTGINKATKIRRRQIPRIKTPVNANVFSLLAKRLQRINLRGAPRRYVAGNKRHGDQRQSDANEGRRIGCAHVKKQTLHDARQGKRRRQPQTHTDQSQEHSLPYHHLQRISRRGA